MGMNNTDYGKRSGVGKKKERTTFQYKFLGQVNKGNNKIKTHLKGMSASRRTWEKRRIALEVINKREFTLGETKRVYEEKKS